ncbi:MAG: ergothioneine biosynthesis glutamate--cysteine ligase EgtA, partial [Actinomycetota bacterium]|nr:ergothioneine biosynthesis glutamate--cysteine ligase EgtA [Actinomycetota bacterium]
GDRGLLAAAQRCVDIAARRCPAALRADVEAYAELVHRGRSPGDDLREAAELRGPLAALVEAADA